MVNIGMQLVSQIAEPRRRTCDRNGFTLLKPEPRSCLGEPNDWFVWIFEYQHPLCERGHAYFRRSAIGTRECAVDLGPFHSTPISPRINVCPVGIVKQQELPGPVIQEPGIGRPKIQKPVVILSTS